MPVAFTQQILSQQWSSTLLRSTITNALVSIGYVLEGSTGDDLFFSYDLPTNAPKDRGFIRLNITNSTATNIKIQQWFSDAYTTNALTNPVQSFTDTHSGSANIGYASGENFPIKICTYKSSEIALISIIRSDNASGLFHSGFLFPSIRPSWWDNNSLYGFVGSHADYGSLRAYSINPVTVNVLDLSYLLANSPSAINPGGSRDLIRRIIITANTSGIICGATSTDIGLIGASGLNPLTQIQDNNQTWINLKSGSSLAIRIA